MFDRLLRRLNNWWNWEDPELNRLKKMYPKFGWSIQLGDEDVEEVQYRGILTEYPQGAFFIDDNNITITRLTIFKKRVDDKYSYYATIRSRSTYVKTDRVDKLYDLVFPLDRLSREYKIPLYRVFIAY